MRIVVGVAAYLAALTVGGVGLRRYFLQLWRATGLARALLISAIAGIGLGTLWPVFEGGSYYYSG
ncbi:MAG: hypothetical protein ABFS14_06440 [Gemmatimonadota bacterium]